MSDQYIENADLIELTAAVVSAYVANNTVGVANLPALITSVHAAFTGADGPAEEPIVELVPAVSIRKSVTDEYLVCLEDGLRFKSMKRHLLGSHGLSPNDYRVKWGLASDYPMVAPAYAEARSLLAKSSGLGQGGRKPKAKPSKRPLAAAS